MFDITGFGPRVWQSWQYAMEDMASSSGLDWLKCLDMIKADVMITHLHKEALQRVDLDRADPGWWCEALMASHLPTMRAEDYLEAYDLQGLKAQILSEWGEMWKAALLQDPGDPGVDRAISCWEFALPMVLMVDQDCCGEPYAPKTGLMIREVAERCFSDIMSAPHAFGPGCHTILGQISCISRSDFGRGREMLDEMFAQVSVACAHHKAQLELRRSKAQLELLRVAALAARTRRCPNIQCEGVVLPGEMSCRDCGFGHYDSPI